MLDKCFYNHIKNQREKLLNRSDICVLNFQGDGETIKDTPLLNILYRGFQLPALVQNIVDCTGHIIGGHKKDDTFVGYIFFNTMNGLDPEKKLVDPHIFYGASVCRKAQNILKVVYPMLSFIVVA